MPTDIAEAFGTVIERSRRHNQALLDHLARVLDALAVVGVTAIPFKGPVLALDAFGDLGLRAFRDLDFLISDGLSLVRKGAAFGFQSLMFQSEDLEHKDVMIVPMGQKPFSVRRREIEIGLKSMPGFLGRGPAE